MSQQQRKCSQAALLAVGSHPQENRAKCKGITGHSGALVLPADEVVHRDEPHRRDGQDQRRGPGREDQANFLANQRVHGFA